MVLAILLLFIAYVAGKGELAQWINLIIPNPATAPTVGGAGQGASSFGSGATGPANVTRPPVTAPSNPWDLPGYIFQEPKVTGGTPWLPPAPNSNPSLGDWWTYFFGGAKK